MTGKIMLRTVAAVLIVATIAGPCMASSLDVLGSLAGIGRFGVKIAVYLLGRGVSIFRSIGRIFPYLFARIDPFLKNVGKRIPKILDMLEKHWKATLAFLGIGWIGVHREILGAFILFLKVTLGLISLAALFLIMRWVWRNGKKLISRFIPSHSDLSDEAESEQSQDL